MVVGVSERVGTSARSAAEIGVRALGPADASDVGAMVGRCGPETLYRRFHGVPNRPAQRLADQVRAEEAGVHLGAFGPGGLLALASLVRHRDAAWEIALLVEDRWQRRGVGRVLTVALGEVARRRGVRRVVVTYLYDAADPVRALLRTGGWRAVSTTVDAGAVEVVLEPRRRTQVAMSG